MNQPEGIGVRVLPQAHAAEAAALAPWRTLLAQSPAASLFHEPEFLAYHPEGRFQFRHLLLAKGGQPLALLPGGMAGTAFRSPLGASFGGPVLMPRLPTPDVMAVLEALQAHARAEGWSSIELTPPPLVYRRDASDTLGFCLQAAGFVLASRMLCHAIPLDGAAPRYEALFRSRARRNTNKLRATNDARFETKLGGAELLDAFLVAFNETYARHGVAPTHSAAELADLLRRLPDRFRIALQFFEGRPVAGLFLMRMSATIENAFYICATSEDAELNASLALFAWTLDRLADDGVALLDLGPSSLPDGSLNRGVCFFKESLGAVGYCRDRWTWSAAS
ncbi:GNAT family N-acetyltransferase [Dongia sp.]|uniref:GNAT family N-acetyltransferase n=1 Tax=Dongia sp. TaxID=1977262 RepID=UPI00375008AC